jgi:hypothetical protein
MGKRIAARSSAAAFHFHGIQVWIAKLNLWFGGLGTCLGAPWPGISETHLAYATCEASSGILSCNHSCGKDNTTNNMGSFNRGFATGLHGKWLQAGITLCSAWAFTLFG